MHKTTNTLDLIKIIACILIVGSHCLPLFRDDMLNLYYGQWFFRFCVPLFLVSTGYFFAKMEEANQKAYIKRIILLYLGASLLYLPLYFNKGLILVISNLIFGFHHLWYLSALAMGLITITIAQKVLANRKYLLIMPLVGGGVLFAEYYKLLNIEELSLLARIVSILGGPKHALFFATPMLLIGDYIAKKRSFQEYNSVNIWACIGVFVLLFSVSFWEATALKNLLGVRIRLDVSLFGWTPSIPLFLLGLNSRTKITPRMSRELRKIADVVYIIHVWIIVLTDRITQQEYISRFLIVIVVSFALAPFALRLFHIIRRAKNS